MYQDYIDIIITQTFPFRIPIERISVEMHARLGNYSTRRLSKKLDTNQDKHLAKVCGLWESAPFVSKPAKPDRGLLLTQPPHPLHQSG